MTTALVPFQHERLPQQVIRIPRGREPQGDATLAELCATFLQSKQVLVDAGEYSKHQLWHVKRMVDRVLKFFGAQTAIEDIRQRDFMALRNSLPKPPRWSVSTTGNEITRVRTLFNFAFNSGIVDRPVRFGPDFKRPPAKAYRKAKREKPSQMFERGEILAMLDAAPWAMRPLILLGVNCGFGDSDVGRIEFRDLDLDGGWHTFARPKTEQPRRCPLWPETIEAIREYLRRRPEPAIPRLAERVFLTPRGTPWAEGGPTPPISKRLKALMRRCGINRVGCNFYGFRRTFRTIGDAAKDSPAIGFMMGHVPGQEDMGALYTQRIEDHRLIAVSDLVRSWLFVGPQKSPEQQAAIEIAKEWDEKAALTGYEIQVAIDRLKIPQTELGRGIGRNSDWMNAVLCGRNSLGWATEMRCRRFITQLAEGVRPTPTVDDDALSETLLDAPISDEAREALSHIPLTREDLAVVVESLQEIGIHQSYVARKAGVKIPFWFKLRAGTRPVPAMTAAKLRVLFGLQSGLPVLPEPVKCHRYPEKLPATPAIEALLNAEEFGSAELWEVVKYLKARFGLAQPKVAAWLGITPARLSHMVYHTSKVAIRPALRSLFEFAEKDGAQ